MKNGFALLVLLFAGVKALAQNNMYVDPGEEPKTFSGGMVICANFSQVDGDTYSGYHKVGLNIGGKVYVHFSSVFGASMEIIYSQKGSKAETVYDSPNIGTYIESYSMKLNYAEVPIVFHIVSAPWDFEAGASFSYLISSSETIISDQPVVVDPVANRFNTTDVDVIAGLTRKIYKHLYGNIRYEYSLTSIRPSDRVPVGYTYGTAGQFNNLFNLRFVYMFK